MYELLHFSNEMCAEKRNSRSDKSRKSEPPPKNHEEASTSTTSSGAKGDQQKDDKIDEPYILSSQLGAIMGVRILPRHTVIKRIWSIIEERNLYDPKNQLWANCDDELFQLFGIRRIRIFGMMKYLQKHFERPAAGNMSSDNRDGALPSASTKN